MTGDHLTDYLLYSNHAFIKEAVSNWDYLNRAGRVISSDLVGSHGFAGWKPALQSPFKHAWQGFKGMPLIFKPLVAMGMASALMQEGGPFERAGRVAGQILPLSLQSLGAKGPGHIGGILAQEGLGGGMLSEGLIPKAGRKLDELLHLTHKEKPMEHWSRFQLGTPRHHQLVGTAQQFQNIGQFNLPDISQLNYYGG